MNTRTVTEVPKTRGLTVSRREKKHLVSTATLPVRFIYTLTK